MGLLTKSDQTVKKSRKFPGQITIFQEGPGYSRTNVKIPGLPGHSRTCGHYAIAQGVVSGYHDFETHALEFSNVENR